MKRKKKKCKEKSVKITGIDMLQKQLLNAEKIVEKFEIQYFVEKEWIAATVRLGLIQKKSKTILSRGTYAQKLLIKPFCWLFTYEKLITAFANQKI